MPKRDEIVNPGAGTLFVYGELDASLDGDLAWDDLPSNEPSLRASPDSLLRRGIADYTFLPASSGGVLGRGKFSTVYKVVGADGRYYALKHTPLYPHHPLISARLLREPTLLAQLPPHPCLIGVDGWVRTDSHFYLVEQFAASHVPLPSHPLPLAPSRAAYILDQLVSVVRDGLHEGGRVCHRDLKGENILIDVDTGDILLLDLGLATHFSMSEPKLTTCCGSPAFHSPEIVHALSKPPGEVTYYGPELDIWCIALTLLSLLTQTRFPLGPSHISRYIMAERARDRIQELDELYPPEAPWRALGPSRRFTASEKAFETSEWVRVRRAMAHFLEMDGVARMRHFRSYDEGDRIRTRLEEYRVQERGNAGFKSITFIPSEVKYTLPLRMDPGSTPTMTPELRPGPLILHNPTGESERRVVSYVKYLLRSAGILYHHLPSSSPPLLQLVLPLAPPTPPSSLEIPPPLLNINTNTNQPREWMSTLLGLGRRQYPRSASVPPKQSRVTPPPPQRSGAGKKGKKEWAQICWMRIDVERGSSISSASTRRSGSAHPCGSRTSSRTRLSGDASNLLFSPVQSKATLVAPIVADGHVDGLSPLPERPPHSRQVSGTIRSNVSRPRNERVESFLSPLSRQTSAAGETTSEQANSSAPITLDLSEPQRPTISRQSTTSFDGSAFGIVSGASLNNTNATLASRAQSQGHQRRALSRARSYIAPLVTITLSEPRGYDLISRALDVVHVESPLTNSSMMSRPSSGRSNVLPIPLSGSSSSENEEDGETQRGRPRSKESTFEQPGNSFGSVVSGGSSTNRPTTLQKARGGRGGGGKATNTERSTIQSSVPICVTSPSPSPAPNTTAPQAVISPTSKHYEYVITTVPVPVTHSGLLNGNGHAHNGGNVGGLIDANDYPASHIPRRIRNPSHTRRNGLFETLFGRGGGSNNGSPDGLNVDLNGAIGVEIEEDRMRRISSERRSSSVPPIGPLTGV